MLLRKKPVPETQEYDSLSAQLLVKENPKDMPRHGSSWYQPASSYLPACGEWVSKPIEMKSTTVSA